MLLLMIGVITSVVRESREIVNLEQQGESCRLDGEDRTADEPLSRSILSVFEP